MSWVTVWKILNAKRTKKNQGVVFVGFWDGVFLTIYPLHPAYRPRQMLAGSRRQESASDPLTLRQKGECLPCLTRQLDPCLAQPRGSPGRWARRRLRCLPSLPARCQPGASPGSGSSLASCGAWYRDRGWSAGRGAFGVEFSTHRHVHCVRCDDLFMQGKATKILLTEQCSWLTFKQFHSQGMCFSSFFSCIFHNNLLNILQPTIYLTLKHSDLLRLYSLVAFCK